MNFEEDEDRQLLRRTVAELASAFGHGYYVQAARSGAPPRELWEALASGGFLGPHIPERYGGGGAGIAELAVVCEELAAAGCPLLLVIVSAAIGATLLTRFGTPAQQQTWLPAMARGKFSMAFALTEPDAGSNTHRLATTARRTNDGYRLVGAKHYITAVDEVDAILVVARDAAPIDPARTSLSLFIVDSDAPGLTRSPIPVQIVAPETQFNLFFDEVPVPAERLLGTAGDGMRELFYGLNPERITSAATCVGIARYALAKAAGYARERQVWEVPIGAHQGLSHPLAEASVQTELAALMTQKAGWLYDRDADAGLVANMAKFAAAEAALQALDIAIQVHGGHGMSTEYGLVDYWGLARLFRTAPVSREMVLNHIAQHALGLPRAY